MAEAALKHEAIEPETAAPERGPIDHVKIRPSFDFASLLKSVSEQHGKSYFAQVKDIYRLKFGPGKVAPVEYFHYGLFDDATSMKQKLAFVGHNLRVEVNAGLLDVSKFEVGIDKIAFYRRAKAAGLPIPQTVAVYHAEKSLEGAAELRTPEAFADWLRTEAAFPLFCKPAKLTASVGAASLERLHPETDEVELADGRRFAVTRFVEEARRYFVGGGYIVQSRLEPHPALAALAAPKASTVRVMVLADPEPKVIRATWRIPAGEDVADVAWRGNLTADIDLETGGLVRVARGRALTYEVVEDHPETGARLKGFAMPDWAAALEAALQGAREFAELPLTGWDVSLTRDGPVLIELEPDGGDPTVTQMASYRGLLDGPYGEWVRRGLGKGRRPR